MTERLENVKERERKREKERERERERERKREREREREKGFLEIAANINEDIFRQKLKGQIIT